MKHREYSEVPRQAAEADSAAELAVAAPPAAEHPELGQHVGRGLAWSFLNNFLSRLGSVASGIVLARLLAPSDYGVFAVALVVLNALLSVNELGVSLAVVRWPGRIDEIAPTVATLSITSSALMYVACFLAAPSVAHSLNAPSSTWVIRLLCLCVLGDGIAAVPAGLITRAFDQRKRTFIDLSTFVIGTLLSVLLAVLGYGAWAMAWGFLVSNVITVVCTVIWAPQRYRPGFDRQVARSLLAFGGPLAASSLVMFFMLNLDYILVGHLLGAVDLGLYLLAFNLSSWPANIVSVAVRRVSLAGFSRLAERPAALGESFARAVAIVLAVALPMSAVLASFAHPLIDVVYGSKWLPAAKVLGLLCVLGAVRVATELAYDFLVALGRTRPNLWLQLLWAGCLVPALYFGAERWGIVGVAGGHACVALIVMVPAFIMVLRRSGVSASLLGTRCARPIAGTVLIVGSALLVRFLVHDSLLELVLGLPLAGLLYLVTVLPMRSLLTTSDLLTAEPSVEETSLSAP